MPKLNPDPPKTSKTSKATRRDENVEMVEQNQSGGYICNVDGCRHVYYNLAIRQLHIRADHRQAAAVPNQPGKESPAHDKSLTCPLENCSATFQKAFQVGRHKWEHIPDQYRPCCRGTMKHDGSPCSYLYSGRADSMRNHWKSHHVHDGEYPAPEYESFERCLAKSKADQRRKERGKRQTTRVSPSPFESSARSRAVSPTPTTFTASTILLVAPPSAQVPDEQPHMHYFDGMPTIPESAEFPNNPWMDMSLGDVTSNAQDPLLDAVDPLEFDKMDWNF
ncbi:hypothetical protein FRB91_009679 [Serendipita sp. 411]|nr:hypothetical protein FRB91_009679 [Serendipita sp. 411]